MDVMILCGGKGERLRALINDRPKPLADFQGQPFLDFLIDNLSRQNFNHFILLAGYQGNMIQAYAKQKNRDFNTHIECIIETFPLGTAGALQNALSIVTTSRLLVLNGDSFCPVDYCRMLNFHEDHSADMTIAASPCEEGKDYGTIVSDENGRIYDFAEKKTSGSCSWVNAGIYIIEKKILDTIPAKQNISLEQEMIPNWIKHYFSVYAYPCQSSHLDIGTPERFATAQEYFQKRGSNIGVEE